MSADASTYFIRQHCNPAFTRKHNKNIERSHKTAPETLWHFTNTGKHLHAFPKFATDFPNIVFRKHSPQRTASLNKVQSLISGITQISNLTVGIYVFFGTTAPLAIAGETQELSACPSLPAHAAAITTLSNLKGMTGQEKVYRKTQTGPEWPDSCQDIHYIAQAAHSVQHPGQYDYSKGWTLPWPYGSALQLSSLPYGTGITRERLFNQNSYIST